MRQIFGCPTSGTFGVRQIVTMEASETRRSWSCMQEYATRDGIEKTGFRVALFVLLFAFVLFLFLVVSFSPNVWHGLGKGYGYFQRFHLSSAYVTAPLKIGLAVLLKRHEGRHNILGHLFRALGSF